MVPAPDPSERTLRQMQALFDTGFYLQASPEISEHDAFRHFLASGGQPGLDPHPLFSVGYYLAENPVVERAGANPLQHFVEVGAGEQRAPHPLFSCRDYRDLYLTASDAPINPLVHFVAEGKRQHKLPRKMFDPGNDRATLESYHDRTRDGLPVVLFVCHVGGGGTERHLRELADALAGRCHCFLLKRADCRLLGAGTENLISLQPLAPAGTGLLFDPSRQLDDLTTVLRRLRVSRVHLHHFLGHESYLRHLLDGVGVPFDVTLHDYYLLSPCYILAGPNGFHGEPEEENVEAQTAAEAAGCTLGKWRDRNRWIVDGADRIIAPSVDARDRFGRFIATEKIIAASHPDLPAARRGAPLARPPRAECDLRVLTVGELYPHKGANVLLEVADLASRRDLPLEFHHLGLLPEHTEKTPSPRLTIHGAYCDSRLRWWIAKLRPHVAWFPAQWPETYSYTLSAALEARLPILAPDLGAFPERLGGRAWSWILPWDLPPGAWCDALVSARECLLAGRPPREPPVKERASESFYPDAYIAGWRSRGVSGEPTE